MRIGLELRLFLLLAAVGVSGAAIAGLLFAWTGSVAIATAGSLASIPPLALILSRRATRPLRRLLRALAGTIASYRDGDFSISLAVERRDELGALVEAHNELGAALREQRQHLVQRELLLETVTRNSPVAMVLLDSHERVVYSNLAARHLLNQGRSLQGLDFAELSVRLAPVLREAILGTEDRLLQVPLDGHEEIFHLSQRRFALRGRPHRLLLLKHLTRELSRQEVAVWKKLIRVLSHELNNSLAPIISLANSGAELARRDEREALPGVFGTIAERAGHLHRFISGYATFARLPAPRIENVSWPDLIASLRAQFVFRLDGELPAQPGRFDRAQVEQALINLLRNAAEAGGDPGAVELAAWTDAQGQHVEVRDRGSGMSDAVLTQALLPFYSTKRDGTGLGLALVREIAEAHGGRVRLANREGGGLAATFTLPR